MQRRNALNRRTFLHCAGQAGAVVAAGGTLQSLLAACGGTTGDEKTSGSNADAPLVYGVFATPLEEPWDGAIHAFVLDTLTAASAQRRGIGTELVAVAAREAKAAGCEWLHVDFDDEHRSFYFDTCGFTPTNAGLIQL